MKKTSTLRAGFAAGLTLLVAGCATHVNTPSSADVHGGPLSTPSISVSAPAILPPFPGTPENQVLVADHHVTGDRTWTTLALTSRNLDLQLACTGRNPQHDAVTLVLWQNGHIMYRIRSQPCNGTIQKIELTADTAGPVKVSGTAPTSSFYAVLLTHS